MRTDLLTLTDWTSGRLVGDPGETVVTGVSTDTRTLRPGHVFFALSGPNFDGHDFLDEAKRQGAVAAVVERDDVSHDFPLIVVSDARRALGLAAHRDRWSDPLIPWVAITGSNGKTTTREMVAQILRLKGPVDCSPQNFNNFVGLPLSMLARDADDWVGIVELGTNAPGEIARLTEIVTPTVAVVTCTAPAHLEGLRSHEGVAHEKADIFRLLPHDGLALFPSQDAYARVLADAAPGNRRTFAVEGQADLVAEQVRVTPTGSHFVVREVPFYLPLLGRHNVANCLAALLVAEHFGISLSEAAEALRALHPVPTRLECTQTPLLTILNDTYNANPGSLRAGVRTLKSIEARRRVVIVGDMRELGDASRKLHREAGRFLSREGIDVILAVGPESVNLAEGAAATCARCIVRSYRSKDLLVRDLPQYLCRGDLVLVKGSRTMHMETVVGALLGLEDLPDPAIAKRTTGVFRKMDGTSA